METLGVQLDRADEVIRSQAAMKVAFCGLAPASLDIKNNTSSTKAVTLAS